MHLADAFIQRDLQCIQAYTFFVSMCVPWELNPQAFCTANAILYHWATGTQFNFRFTSTEPKVAATDIFCQYVSDLIRSRCSYQQSSDNSSPVLNWAANWLHLLTEDYLDRMIRNLDPVGVLHNCTVQRSVFLQPMRKPEWNKKFALHSDFRASEQPFPPAIN